MEGSRRHLLHVYKASYSRICLKFRYYGNRGNPAVDLKMTQLNWPTPETTRRNKK